MNRNKANVLTWFSFLVPALVLYCVFFIYPSVGSLYYSFTDWTGLSKEIDYVGFRNYVRIFSDEALIDAITNTVLLVVIVTVVQNVFALALAEALNGNIKLRKLLRTVFFLPAVISTLAVGFIWSYLYNPIDGIINALLKSIGLSALAQDWLGNPDTALYAIMFIMIWQNVGYSMVIYLSGLQSISESYYEAASIDGANYAQKFKHITFPLIGPAITINVVLCVIGGMKTFDVIYATTGGGPGYSTETFASILFRKAFSGMAEFGYGSAIAVVLFVVILIVSNLLTKFLRSREVES
ncbi:carbohydrate ABC transporter permease [Cohnella soli]|uniref:Carbohydrate ABC transporter permease n=1 Tax=Cohnella soli TaxID=425005 RepID=A0ABW0HYS9_9BACL